MSENRTASCRCGQLRATVAGEPVRVSACHCLDCKKRSGSAFAVQARWPIEQFQSEGASKTWIQLADSGNRITHHFCPECGSGLYYMIENKFDGLIAIPLGAFDGLEPSWSNASLFAERAASIPVRASPCHPQEHSARSASGSPICVRRSRTLVMCW